MNDFSRILLPSCRMPVLGLMLALAVARPAAAADYTDLWWNALESGWGVNFIQADNFIFATFFVYDGGSQPIWYSAEMTSDDKGVWSGPLYLTAGTYFGAPWNPSQRGINQVGSASFTPTSSVAGTLAYNVANAVVTKQVTRQALKTIPIGAGYFGGIVSERYNCQIQPTTPSPASMRKSPQRRRRPAPSGSISIRATVHAAWPVIISRTVSSTECRRLRTHAAAACRPRRPSRTSRPPTLAWKVDGMPGSMVAALKRANFQSS